jgi:hypothetical protein
MTAAFNEEKKHVSVSRGTVINAEALPMVDYNISRIVTGSIGNPQERACRIGTPYVSADFSALPESFWSRVLPSPPFFLQSPFSPSPLFVCPAQVRLINSYLISERGRASVLLSCARRKWRRISRGLRAADSGQPAYCILLITTVCGRLFCFPPRCQFVDRYWIQPR